MWPFRKKPNITKHDIAELVKATLYNITDLRPIDIYIGEVSLSIVIADESKGSLYYTDLLKAAHSPKGFVNLLMNRIR